MDSSAVRLVRRGVRAVLCLVTGARTALLCLVAMVAFVLVGALSILGLWRLLPPMVTRTRRLADAERRRLARYREPPIVASYHRIEGSLSKQVSTVSRDPATRRDLMWMVVHGSFGLACALLAVGLPLGVLNALLLPCYWWAIPGGVPSSVGYWVDSWWLALLSPFVAVVYFAIGAALLPVLAGAQQRVGRMLLSPRGDELLSARVVELAASRVAALEAHGNELRRIERDLHDGTQNRLVAVAMHLGIVERALHRVGDPAVAAVIPLVLDAQNATGDAVFGLREVIRSIYPPILGERGLHGALVSLVAGSQVPCQLRMDTDRRMPAAVETAAYFAVAETLTNVMKHSEATEAGVRVVVEGESLVVEIRDDGRGGARETPGGGLAGLRRRVSAFDGRMTLISPVGGPTVLRLELPIAS